MDSVSEGKERGQMECCYRVLPRKEEVPERGSGQNLVENVGTLAESPGAWRDWLATQQQQQVAKQQHLFQHMFGQQKVMLDQLVIVEVQASNQLWKSVERQDKCNL